MQIDDKRIADDGQKKEAADDATSFEAPASIRAKACTGEGIKAAAAEAATESSRREEVDARTAHGGRADAEFVDPLTGEPMTLELLCRGLLHAGDE